MLQVKINPKEALLHELGIIVVIKDAPADNRVGKKHWVVQANVDGFCGDKEGCLSLQELHHHPSEQGLNIVGKCEKRWRF